MKTMKKFLVMLLAFLVLDAVTSTAWAEEGKDVELENLESYRMDITTAIGMDMSMMGESITDTQMEMEGTLSVTFNPERCYMDLTATGNGETQRSITCYEAQGSQYVVYSSLDEGKTWEKQTVTRDVLPNGIISSVDSFKKLAKFTEELDHTGTEEKHGQSADIYSGVLSGKQIQEYMAISGALDSILQPYGIDLSTIDPALLGKMPVTIAVDSETGMVLRFEMDMREMLQNLMQSVVEATFAGAVESGELPNDFDISSLDIIMTINEASGSTSFYDFNAVGEIQIPKMG